MPRYYFHLQDSDIVVDDEGVELADLATACGTAAEFFGTAIRDAGRCFFESEDWRLDVTDENGLILFSAIAYVQDVAASPRNHRSLVLP